jgi:hypothetical protein
MMTEQEKEGYRRQIEIYRRMTPVDRLSIAAGLYRTARTIRTAAVRAQNPDWSQEQVNAAVREAFLHART